MAITTDPHQSQKQKRGSDSQGPSSRDQGQRSQKDQRTNQNPRTNWGRDQEANSKQKTLYCVFHGEDKGHTTKNFPETEKTNERMR